jgi:hypothetical protein
MMKNRRGEPISIDDIRKQLDKVGIEGKLQDDAIAFGMAYWELGGPDQDPEVLAQQNRAEASALRNVPATYTGAAADKVLMGPELALERTARLDAARPSAMTPAPPAPAAAPVAAPAAAPEEELVFGGGVVEPRRASAATRRPAPPAAAGAAPAAPLKPRKTSDRVLDAMQKMDANSDEYEASMKQLTRLLEQGD